MTRLGTLVWFVLVLAAGFATFKVKYAVQNIEDQLTRVRKQTVAEQQEIRVLTAEWTYLTQPERLAELNRRFIGLQPISAKQLQHAISDLPMRARPAAPDTVVATAVSPPVVAQAAAPVMPAPAVPAPVATATAGPTPQRTAPVQLAKASPAAPKSLDALITQIAETR
jgi:hypothetical protein